MPWKFRDDNIISNRSGAIVWLDRRINKRAGRRLDLRAQPKFRCHGNKGRPHNILHGAIESAIPENPLVDPNISGPSAIQADLQGILCKFRCHGNKGRPHNILHGSIQSAIPENPWYAQTSPVYLPYL